MHCFNSTKWRNFNVHIQYVITPIESMKTCWNNGCMKSRCLRALQHLTMDVVHLSWCKICQWNSKPPHRDWLKRYGSKLIVTVKQIKLVTVDILNLLITAVKKAFVYGIYTGNMYGFMQDHLVAMTTHIRFSTWVWGFFLRHQKGKSSKAARCACVMYFGSSSLKRVKWSLK